MPYKDPIKKKEAKLRYCQSEKGKATAKQWRQNNHQNIVDAIERYRAKPEKKKLLKEAKQRNRENNPSVDISLRLRSTIASALKASRTSKSCRTLELIGCSYSDLAKHLESQFVPGMSWDNRRLWHIDHIRPCASFDLTEPEQQKQCFHWSNMRPLWALDNMKKGSSYTP